MSDWAKFQSALVSRGLSFDKIRHASDRPGLIHAMGFTDPVAVAVIETQWAAQVGSSGSAGAAASQSAAAAAPSARPLPADAASADPAALATAPLEVQERLLVDEVLHVLRGHGGSLITIEPNGRARIARDVPMSLAKVIEPLLDVTAARHALDKVKALETIDHTERSRVKGAIAEAVREVDMQYVRDVSELAARCRTRSFPVARLVAEATIVCFPVRRLARVFADLSSRQQRRFDEVPGEVLLSELHKVCVGAAGNTDDARLLGYVVRRAARPYALMLRAWMTQGELDDPYGEFFVVPTGRPSKPNDALSFMDRFTCSRGKVPAFLEPVYRQVFYSGRYCMLLRESGEALPQLEEDRLEFDWGNADALEAAVRYAHDVTSRELMQVLLSKSRLQQRLESLKLYLLHGRGDWLENFLEAAGEMLARSHGQVRAYNLNVVLQAEIAKCCAHDPFHGGVRFSLSEYSVVELVARVRAADPTMAQVIATSGTVRQSLRRSVGPGAAAAASALRSDVRSVLDLMQLQVESDWLISLVFSAPFLAKLNIVFRVLLWCKLCERDLNDAWWRRNHGIPAAASLRLKLLQFVRQYFFYAVHHVIDPAWHRMTSGIATANGIREVSSHTAAFCDEAFRGMAIRSKHAFDALSRILQLVHRFSELGRSRVPGDDKQRAPMAAKIAEYDGEFNRLLARLGDPQERDYGRLVPLLTWLDFSGFYARQGVYRVYLGAAALDELGGGDDATTVGRESGRVSSATSVA